MEFDCYTVNQDLIPTDRDSLGKLMNLCTGQPMPCERKVVSP